MTSEVLTKLRNTLANLYPDEDSIRRIIHDMGLAASRINFSSTAINIWHSALLEAEKLNGIDKLLQIVQNEYGTNKEFQDSCDMYYQSEDEYENILTDILQNGPKSEYWEGVVPYQWKHDPKSWVNQMYIAGLVHGFRDSEIMSLIEKRSGELEFVLEETGFQFWLKFFADRRSRRSPIKPQNPEEADILRHGKYSKYWSNATGGLRWDKDSPEVNLYVAGKIYGLSHREILAHIKEQTNPQGCFPQIGFFGWIAYLEEIREKQAEPEPKSKEFDVLTIPYHYYKNIVLNEKQMFKELFLSDGKLNEEWLRDIHFNATHSMAGSTVDKKEVAGFIRGTLVGCISAGIAEVKLANKRIRDRSDK